MLKPTRIGSAAIAEFASVSVLVIASAAMAHARPMTLKMRMFSSLCRPLYRSSVGGSLQHPKFPQAKIEC
jgi:hypothetical protein